MYFCIIFVILLILAHISLRIRELEACLASHYMFLYYMYVFFSTVKSFPVTFCYFTNVTISTGHNTHTAVLVHVP